MQPLSLLSLAHPVAPPLQISVSSHAVLLESVGVVLLVPSKHPSLRRLWRDAVLVAEGPLLVLTLVLLKSKSKPPSMQWTMVL